MHELRYINIVVLSRGIKDIKTKKCTPSTLPCAISALALQHRAIKVGMAYG